MSAMLNQIVKKLAQVPARELPAVLQLIEASSAKKRAKGGAQALVQHLAQQAVAADMSGNKLDEVERAIVAHAYEISRRNVSAAARLLGIERKAVERRLVLYGIGRPRA